MKKIPKILFLLALACLSACKKYEEGPSFSLMTKKARLANIWYVDKYYINGADKTADYRQGVSREKLVIYESGRFEYSEVSTWVWAPMEYVGSWKFTNDKEDVELRPDDASIPVQSSHILKLKNDELWLEREVMQGMVVEYHYLPLEHQH